MPCPLSAAATPDPAAPRPCGRRVPSAAAPTPSATTASDNSKKPCRHGQPQGLRSARRVIDAVTRPSTAFDDLMATEDTIEGLTAFAQKRPPQWRNR